MTPTYCWIYTGIFKMIEGEIISRGMITPNIRYYDGNTLELKTIDEFKNSIAFWKTILYEGYGLRPGNTISVFDTSIRFNYCCLLFAASELGLRIVLAPENAKDNSGKTEKMDALTENFGLIDLCLLDDSCYEIPAVVSMVKLYGKNHVHVDIFNSYEIKDSKCYDTMLSTVFAKPTDTLLISCTSGTTGEPKVLSYTHQQMYRLTKRVSNVYDYSGKTVCHTRNMHHPFIFMMHFLPAFYCVSDHYSYPIPALDNVDIVKSFVDYIISNKISKLVLSARLLLDAIIDYMIKNTVQFEHDIDIITGGFYLTEDYVDKIRKTNIKNIYSTFGSNETTGPLLLRCVNKDTDTNDYKNNYLGKPCDDFFNMRLLGRSLQVQCPPMFGDRIITLSDDIEGDVENGFYHLGRSNFYRINDVEFKVIQITNIIQEYFSGKFNLVVDIEYQKLYLILWEGSIDFTNLNQQLTKTLGIAISDYALLNPAIYDNEFKLNQEKMREYFRARTI